MADGHVVHLVDPAGRRSAVRVAAVKADAAAADVAGDHGVSGQVAVAADGSWLLLYETDDEEPAVEVRRFAGRAEVGRWLWGHLDDTGINVSALLLFHLGLLRFDPRGRAGPTPGACRSRPAGADHKTEEYP